MKPRLIPSLALLATLAATAQEVNPFLNEPRKEETPATASGETFVTLTENILVPSDLLDGWLDRHPLTDNATDLRSAVQGWVAEGKAVLDHTAVTSGIAGLDCENESILEQIYATEYEPPQPGRWPRATSFETRNLGYSLEGGAVEEDGGMLLLANVEFDRMLPHQAPHPLAEATREPGDVFIPRFQTVKITQSPAVDPRLPVPVESDPFADPPKPLKNARNVSRFTPGRIHLVARVEDKVPGPFDPGTKPAEVERFLAEYREKHPGERVTRLIFFRGAIQKSPEVPQPPISGNYPVSARFVRVDHRLFSDWLQARGLADISTSAAAAVDEWRKAGRAEVVADLTSTGRAGSATEFGDYVEISYPTEWESSPQGPDTDGKPAPEEFSSGTSFETRYTGLLAETAIIPDPEGPILKFLIQQVIRGGESVHHRILRDNKWQADIKFPVFTTNRWNSNLRLARGQWMLVGSDAAIDASGRFDPARSLLAFVKVE